MSFGDRFCMNRKGGTGGGGCMCVPEGCKQHGYVWAQLGKHLGTGWAVSFLLCKNGLRKQSSNRVGPTLLAAKLLFSGWMSYCRPRAMTITSLLWVGVVWITCVKFGDWKHDITVDMGSLTLHAWVKSDLQRKITEEWVICTILSSQFSQVFMLQTLHKCRSSYWSRFVILTKSIY